MGNLLVIPCQAPQPWYFDEALLWEKGIEFVSEDGLSGIYSSIQSVPIAEPHVSKHEVERSHQPLVVSTISQQRPLAAVTRDASVNAAVHPKAEAR